MNDSLWGRLNLRWQAAVAVLLPCVAIGMFASFYFPSRLNSQSEQGVQSKVLALGAMAAAQLSPSLGFIKSGLGSTDEFDKVFEGIRAGESVEYVGFVWTQRETRSVVADASNTPRAVGKLSAGPHPLPAKGCVVDSGATVVLRCLVKSTADESDQGLLVASFKKDALLAAQRENQQAGWFMLLAAVATGLVLAAWFSRALATPVALVTQAAREVAAGDVTVDTVEVVAAREIRSMAASFNEMLASLRNLVGQMVNLTGRLSNASEGLVGASQDQEHVTSQQAAYAQQIAATFEELSRTAEQISTSTEVVEKSARRTNEAVEEAKAVVAQVVEAIREIRSESKGVSDSILKLNTDLQQVSKIAQVINAVAERSDLLALNAALEGTKAGDVGRGFSLVAAEMRKLAENVSGSARDIGRIVEQVKESSNEAVSKARESSLTSERGMNVAERASSVFEVIVELARGTTEAAQQISIASRQQRQSSEQAVAGARNVADLVKQGVDATGRTNKIAQDLASVAAALSTVTGKFKVVRRS